MLGPCTLLMLCVNGPLVGTLHYHYSYIPTMDVKSAYPSLSAFNATYGKVVYGKENPVPKTDELSELRLKVHNARIILRELLPQVTHASGDQDSAAPDEITVALIGLNMSIEEWQTLQCFIWGDESL